MTAKTAKTVTTVLSIRKFPPELHKRIKIAATAASVSVQDYVTNVLDSHVPKTAKK
jgi:predicted HicB family RNase H-like nuclease